MDDKSERVLKSLIQTKTPSGYEQEGLDKFTEHAKSIGTSVQQIGPLGSRVAKLLLDTAIEASPRMLCAHIDQIGMMVHHIDDKGFVRVSGIGGHDLAVWAGQPLRILGKSSGESPPKDVYGIISRVAVHMLELDERKRLPKQHEFIVDIGAASKDEAMQRVCIGDPAVLGPHFHRLGEKLISATALDDKAGVWAMLETLRILHMEPHFTRRDVYAVASVQEENGMLGAKQAAAKINMLNEALAIDVTHATDTPSTSCDRYGDIKLGKGPVIGIGSVLNRSISNELIRLAEKADIPYQLEATPRYSGTDADGIALFGRGEIAVGLVSIPLRYMHTPVETCHEDDLDNVIKLLVEWCKS